MTSNKLRAALERIKELDGAVTEVDDEGAQVWVRDALEEVYFPTGVNDEWLIIGVLLEDLQRRGFNIRCEHSINSGWTVSARDVLFQGSYSLFCDNPLEAVVACYIQTLEKTLAAKVKL